LDKIHKARNSTHKIEYLNNITSILADNITKIAVDQFMKSTVGFESHSCLNSRDESITSIYLATNCYYSITVDIHRQVDASFPRVSVVLGETSSYSNFNNAHDPYITISLGPLYILIFKF